jgi:DNA-binding transcriptional MerR regulator
MTEDLVPIGRFAQAARLSHKALRLYDENGLLPPVEVDADSGYRYYAWEQLRRARRIALLREAGMPLAEIGRFLAEPRPEALDAYRARLVAEHARRLEVLDFVRTTSEEEPMYDVSVKQAPEQAYVSRTEEDLPQERVEEFVISALRELAREHEPADAPFTLYHGLAPDGGDGGEVTVSPVEVCLPTADGDRVLPAAEVAFTVARGDDRCRYPQIVAAYDAVWEWAREHGRELEGPPREIYRFRAGEERVFEIAWPLR